MLLRGFRHQPARAEDAAEPADLPHQLALRDGDIEVRPAVRDARDQLVAARLVRARRERLRDCLALGEHDHGLVAAEAVREGDRTADLLLRVPAVQARAEVQLNGLVELRGRALAHDAQRLIGFVEVVGVDLLGGGLVALASLWHR